MKTRLYFILSDENLFHTHYLLGVIKTLDTKAYKITGITLALDMYKKGYVNFLNQQLHLWGVLGFLFIALMSTIRRFLSKLGIKKTFSITGIADLYKIPVVESYNVNDKEHIKYLKKLNIDIIISSNGHIFKKEILNLPKIACINRHTALLPKYGGVLPVFWAMYHNESKFGVSVHYMVLEIDKGDILYQTVIPLNKHNSMFKNYILAFDLSIDVTVKALYNIKNKKIMKHNLLSEKSYFSFPSFETINEFKNKYNTFLLIDILTYCKTFWWE